MQVRLQERVNVGVMMAGQGRVADVFDATASFLKERRRKEEDQLRAKRAYSPAQEEARRCEPRPRAPRPADLALAGRCGARRAAAGVRGLRGFRV